MSYIKHGFIAAVYEPWVAYEGSEWGDQMRALHHAYQMGEDYAGFDDQMLNDIESILRRTLEAAHKDGWLDGDCAHQARLAVESYQETYDYWSAQVSSEGDRVEFAIALQRIPEWMKSPLNNQGE